MYIILHWLLEKGFTIEQINNYARSKKYTLEDLTSDTKTQIDAMIVKRLLLELYELYEEKFINLCKVDKK